MSFWNGILFAHSSVITISCEYKEEIWGKNWPAVPCREIPQCNKQPPSTRSGRLHRGCGTERLTIQIKILKSHNWLHPFKALGEKQKKGVGLVNLHRMECRQMTDHTTWTLGPMVFIGAIWVHLSASVPSNSDTSILPTAHMITGTGAEVCARWSNRQKVSGANISLALLERCEDSGAWPRL